MEVEPSASAESSSPSAGSCKPRPGGSGKQGASKRDSSKKVYSFPNSPRGYVYFLNYVKDCEQDVERLKLLFEELDYECIKLPSVPSYETFVAKLQKHQISRSSAAIVFFFGYGYGNKIFIGENNSESLSHEKFIDTFWDIRNDQEDGGCVVLFTNTCFKGKTDAKPVPADPLLALKDSFHIDVKINGSWHEGSPLANVLLRIYKEGGLQESFRDFMYNVTRKVRDLPRSKQDRYITDVCFYGSCKRFYFIPPADM